MTKTEIQKRAARFKATRKQHSSETAEDYTELIADLIIRDGTARIGTIAEQLGVSHVTTLRTVRRLEKEGYVKAPQHRPVELTKLGVAVAKAAKAKHELLVTFLQKLGVPAQIAETDVEGIEHHISDVTLKCISKFVSKK